MSPQGVDVQNLVWIKSAITALEMQENTLFCGFLKINISVSLSNLQPTDQSFGDDRNESVLIQLAQCWFPGLAISSAKI